MAIFNQAEYLDRIGLTGPISPDITGLVALHNAQAFSIPFENLDIFLGREIKLDEESIFDKLVTRKRGGYCFELNGLFYLALKSFEFQAERVLAKVLYGRPEPGPRTHQAMIVTMDGQEWQCDVGFGGPGLISPIPLLHEREDQQFGSKFRVLSSNGITTLQKAQDSNWMNLYQFDRTPVSDVDLIMSNFYTSCFPTSTFKITRITTMPKADGRVTLTNNELSVYSNGQVSRRHLASGAELVDALALHFGLQGEARFLDFPELPEPTAMH